MGLRRLGVRLLRSPPDDHPRFRTFPRHAAGRGRLVAHVIAGEARGCLLALNLSPAGDGYGLVLEDCRLPELAKARSWRMTQNGLEMRDEHGAVLTRLRRRNVDSYKAQGQGPAYLMERAPLS